jgi:hypothetical protein
MTVVRRVFAVLAWVYLAGVVVQFFLAGLGLPQLGGEGMGAHAEFGYIALHLTPILLILGSTIGRTGRVLIVWTVVLAVVAFVQPIWVAGFQGRVLASMHVLGAVALLAVSYHVARLATSKVRAEAAT